MKQLQKLKLWVEGARPKTIPAAITPVIVGTASVSDNAFMTFRFILAILVSVSLQVGVNYANDYSDGIRGTDEERVGPRRLVGSALIPARNVKFAALLAFGFACACGLFLAIMTSIWLIGIGFLSVLAGWFYTGGKTPYGYRGLGEVSVFVFFGLVATAGSAFVQIETFSGLAIVSSIPVGFLAMALLVINNLRDIETDTETDKRTLAVLLGAKRTKNLFLFLVFSSVTLYCLFSFFSSLLALLVLACLPLCAKILRLVRKDMSSQVHIKVLELTAKLHMTSGGLYALGLWIGL